MSGAGEKLLRSLGAIAGEANTSGDPRVIEAYAIDGLTPQAVVRPANADEVVEILRLCAAERLALVPAGAGTKLRMGAAPARYDVVLVSTRMDRVHEYDPGDLTLSVEPGARMAGLASQLAEHRQFLPLPVPFQERATIGGTVASGVDSPFRQSCGTTRDFLLGAEFVTGNRIRAKSGGRVVKNVAGYDLHKLFIGSLGTLGVITRLNFKTFPAPDRERGFLAPFATESGALDFVQRVAQSPLAPATLEILSPSLAALFARRAPPAEPRFAPLGSWFPTSEWLVTVGFGGSEAALQRFREELDRIGGEAGTTGAVALDDETWPGVRERLREAVPLLLDVCLLATILRVSVVPNRMGEISTAARRSAERHALPVAILGRGAGAMYIAFLPEAPGEEALGRLALAVGEVTEAVANAHGFNSVPWCPTELKSRVPLWGRERPDLGLMQKVKRVFDPEGILSPGRFVGGL